MEMKGLGKALILAVLAAVFAAEVAYCQTSCTNVLISLSPCLSYITGNSSTPSSSCCTQLATVVRSQPQCLCQVLNGGASSLGMNINQTQALALPAACKVQTQPVSRCNADSPASSPAGTPDSPSTTVPSGSGTKNTPATGVEGSSAGISTRFSIPLLVALLLVASYASAS
ncbi:hypothetical protein MLD38_020477 [Melastoma candidum]|uniref:Uncharacterized protein n=1 Tax=Melastoma candidum TaxID=119954 RepID=A0ACB9QD13_9MYRT|nr:hypothetical protein MLD38_020477 [Melastoma candidum]